MTLEELSAFTERVTYKPGYAISAFVMGSGAMLRIMTAMTEDADKPDDKDFVSNNYFISEQELAAMTEEHLVQVIKAQVRYLEEHEIKEWLKIDGLNVDNPHPEHGPRVLYGQPKPKDGYWHMMKLPGLTDFPEEPTAEKSASLKQAVCTESVPSRESMTAPRTKGPSDLTDALRYCFEYMSPVLPKGLKYRLPSR